jgi:uncharacterized protein
MSAPTATAKPLVPYGWFRALLYTALFVLLLIGFQVLMGRLYYRLQRPGVALPFTQFIFIGIGTCLAGLLSSWLFMRFINRMPYQRIGWQWRGFGLHGAAGLSLGLLLPMLGTLLLWQLKMVTYTDINWNGGQLFFLFLAMLLVSVGEEVAMRGYVQGQLAASFGPWIALLLSAVLFMAIHLGNPGLTPVAYLNLFLGGILLGLNYAFTRNLWFGIGLHLTWNFTQGPLLGYEVSGIGSYTLLEQSLSGPSLLTGGAFGFEGSLVASLLLLLSIAALAWVYKKKQKAGTPLPEA